MQNKILIIVLLLLLAFSSAAKDLDPRLIEADKLKYDEKYEEAERLYDEILENDPDNLEAIQGKDDCRIMIEPVIPVQHLAVPAGWDDPEYVRLVKQLEEAQTPWDKRRAEIALDRCALRYTGYVFSQAKKKMAVEVDKIIKEARRKIENGRPAERVYLEAEAELKTLQESAHRNWKGHGPEFLKEALEKLDAYYEENDLPNPSQLLILSIKTTPVVTMEGQEVDLTAAITNKSLIPVILIDLQLEGLNYKTFSWQKAMYGSLSYDKEKDQFTYNSLAQQETYNIFNIGMLFPGHTILFSKKVRIPKPDGKAYITYAKLDRESIKHVYAPSGASDVYSPATLAKLKDLAEDNVSVAENNPFPSSGTIIFDDSYVQPATQAITLDLR
jgi:hypothetical protein